jgi:hypothetical protein
MAFWQSTRSIVRRVVQILGTVLAQEATSIQLDGVGHYVAQEAPQPLADILIEAFATNTP